MIKIDDIKKNSSNIYVSLMLGKINDKISWKLTEQRKIKLLKSLNKRKNDYYNGVYKIPQIGYQGCLLNLPPQNIYVFRNLIINKYNNILKVYSDKNRRFEKEILRTAPRNIIPDLIYELEF